LVKQHHPDVFANASEAQQKMAEEKFLKIQEAYEGMLDK
jgi:DnaJ-class molecular chaperone